MKQIIDSYSFVIIGSGFAGCSAAIYIGMNRNKDTKDCLILAGDNPGGLINTTEIVDNYLGVPGISGPELGEKILSHARQYSDIVEDLAIGITTEGSWKYVETHGSIYKCKGIIVCSGSKPRELEQIKDRALYCAICDGFLYKRKTVAVIGGGNAAFESVLYLSALCERVYLIHRTKNFRAFKILQDQVSKKTNIEIITEEEVISFEGTDLKLTNKTLTGINGVFINIGNIPNTWFINCVDKDELGYLKVDHDLQTSVRGIFAAGDVVKNDYNQAVVATGDGARAGLKSLAIIAQDESAGLY